MRPCFRPIGLLAVVQVHAVIDEAGTVVEMQERVAGELFGHGRGRRDTVIVARPDERVIQ